MICDQVRLCLGAYALGSLDPGEDEEVRTHLDGCELCREEMTEFEGLPGLLADLTIEEASGPVQLSPTLYESLRARAAAEETAVRPRHRRLTLVAAAAVTALALGGGTFAYQQLQHGPKTFIGHTDSIQLAVQLKARPTGTALSVKVRGLPAHQHCELVAVGRNGAREDAGWWIANYEGEAIVTGMTSVPVPDLTAILVVDEHGKTLVRTNV
jgi:Putative zinc-finger